MAEEKTDSSEKTSISSNNTSSQANSANQAGTMNIPDWLMHLLTGVGAMGGNYVLFIKPLQEKMDALNQLIIKQDRQIDDMQDQINLLTRKTKRETNEDEPKHQKHDDFFKVKERTKEQPMYGSKKSVRF